MKSDDKSSASDSFSFQKGNNKGQKMKRKKKNDRNVKTNKVVRASHPSQKESKGGFPYHAILNSGMEWTVVGSPAWDIQKTYSKALNMPAVDDSMRCISMNCCNAVTAVQNGTVKICLLGIYAGN
eukprot:12025300-Ditylum_brightwellii.AAC.1